MENLNAEQIKQDIDNCIEGECELCSYYDQTACKEYLMHDALALINSQEQDKEKLGLLIDEIEKEKRELFEENKRLTEENERLKIDVEVCGAELSRYTENIVQMAKQDRAVTVRKVADLLWQGESEKLNISVGGKYYDKQEFIDRIAQEMLEGINGIQDK